MALPSNRLSEYKYSFDAGQCPLAICARCYRSSFRPSRFACLDLRSQLHCHDSLSQSDWICWTGAGQEIAKSLRCVYRMLCLWICADDLLGVVLETFLGGENTILETSDYMLKMQLQASSRSSSSRSLLSRVLRARIRKSRFPALAMSQSSEQPSSDPFLPTCCYVLDSASLSVA